MNLTMEKLKWRGEERDWKHSKQFQIHFALLWIICSETDQLTNRKLSSNRFYCFSPKRITFFGHNLLSLSLTLRQNQLKYGLTKFLKVALILASKAKSYQKGACYIVRSVGRLFVGLANIRLTREY
jgi:hypothetical protein